MPPNHAQTAKTRLSRLRHIKSRAQQFFGLVYYQPPIRNGRHWPYFPRSFRLFLFSLFLFFLWLWLRLQLLLLLLLLVLLLLWCCSCCTTAVAVVAAAVAAVFAVAVTVADKCDKGFYCPVICVACYLPGSISNHTKSSQMSTSQCFSLSNLRCWLQGFD